jgi:hypothetical protein
VHVSWSDGVQPVASSKAPFVNLMPTMKYSVGARFVGCGIIFVSGISVF